MKNRAIIYLGILSSITLAQVKSSTDTLLVKDGQIMLKHDLIIDTTLVIQHLKLNVNDFHLFPAKGIVQIASLDNDSEVIAHYNYLNLIIPRSMGPLYTQFPLMDSILINNEVEEEALFVFNKRLSRTKDNIISTGSIYRSIMISPLGGSEMTGGLRMQMQGQLSENMQVSGILSDEQSPIQPEGNTQSLEEIDQLYIHVSHPQFQVDAGDITLNYNHGKYMNISKRLIGLNNNFNIGKWKGSSVFAGSKGHYRQIEFKGMEGKQGPYFLDSESGNRNIVVQAGTDKVWVDGKKLSRGENHDYTIDYSTAEVYFTPNHLIHSDTDILVEYQYSDFQYSQNVLGGTIGREYTEKGSISIAWLSEKDQIKGESLNLSEEEIEILDQAGDDEVIRSGAVIDSLGDYIYVGREYFEYQPNINVLGNRYSVTFTNDNENGQYRRLISSKGEIYYEYLPEELRESTNDLYSPLKKLVSPKGQQLFEMSGNYFISKNTQLNFSTAASNYDKNLLSSGGDGNNSGLAYSLTLSNNEIQLSDKTAFRYAVTSWQENDRFQSLQRDRSVLFYQNWNINPNKDGFEQYNQIETGLKVEGVGTGLVSSTNYQNGNESLNRLFTSFEGQTHFIPAISAQISDISGKRGYFRQRSGAVEIFPGSWHPFFTYRFEEQELTYQFEHQTLGVKYAKDRWYSSLSVGERLDYTQLDTSNNELKLSSEGIFGSFDVRVNNVNGWTQEMTIRQRIKDDKLGNQNYNFTLGKVRTSFRKPRHPLRWDMTVTVEEKFSESRALVYDSVGVGLGDFRYDEQYNEYVSDPNGEYVAYTIFTGDRYPTTKLDCLQLFEFEFGKTKIQTLRNFSFRSELRLLIEGNLETAKSIVFPDLGDSTIARSKWSIRNEITYKPSKENELLKVWQRQFRNLDGFDNRGQNLNNEAEIGIEYRNSFFENFTNEIKLLYHDSDTESSISDLRQRNSNGFWLEALSKWRYDQWLLEGAVQYGNDEGQQRNIDFTAQSVGLRLDILKFIGSKGRIQSRLEWFDTVTGARVTALPPEALHGLALGKTIRSNIQGQWMMGRGISVNLSLHYISDKRYDQFISMNGEIRAYF